MEEDFVDEDLEKWKRRRWEQMAQLRQISDQQTEFQMTDSELQQRPDCPEYRGIMEKDSECLRLNRNPSSDEEEEEKEDEGFSSDAGVSVKSDMSNDRLNHFPLDSELQQRPDRSEWLMDDTFKSLRVNVNPSSDEDISSDSGVSVNSDRSNGRLINLSLRRRRSKRELPSWERSYLLPSRPLRFSSLQSVHVNVDPRRTVTCQVMKTALN